MKNHREDIKSMQGSEIPGAGGDVVWVPSAGGTSNRPDHGNRAIPSARPTRSGKSSGLFLAAKMLRACVFASGAGNRP